MGFLAALDLQQTLFHCFYSLSRVFVGLIAAVIIGVLLGLLRSSLPDPIKKNRFLKFIFEAPKFPPPIAWIPFVILIFGIGELSAYAIVFLAAFSPIFTSTYEGAESVSIKIRNFARSLELKGLKYLFLIILPASLPQILTGIRVGISMGWMAVIAAEMISGQSGLGYSIQLNRLNMRYDLMILDMILIGFIGFLLYEGTLLLERKGTPWSERTLF